MSSVSLYFKPPMDYWTVEMFTRVTANYSHENKKIWKFNYEKGYDPSEYVKKVWGYHTIHLRNSEFIHDSSNVYYKFTNYLKLDNEEMFNKLNLERLTPSCYF